MQIERQMEEDGILRIAVEGRCDASAAAELDEALAPLRRGEAKAGVLDASAMEYISSMGIRALLSAAKACGGALALVGLQPYCAEIVRLSGLDSLLASFATAEAAIRHLREAGTGEGISQPAMTHRTAGGSFTLRQVGSSSSILRVMGGVRRVLEAGITHDDLRPASLNGESQSVGIGALGADLDSCLDRLGELMLLGGAAVCHQTGPEPSTDFLCPPSAEGSIAIPMAQSVSWSGPEQYCAHFVSENGTGAPLGAVCSDLMDWLRENTSGFRGIAWFSMFAACPAFYGRRLRRSPNAAQRPANGKLIDHPSNEAHWFETDIAPSHMDAHLALCGLGIDLDADLSDYDEDLLGRILYIAPAHCGLAHRHLHLQAAVCSPAAPPPADVPPATAIRDLLARGAIIELARALENTRIAEARIAVSSIAALEPDPTERRIEQADLSPVAQRLMRTYQAMKDPPALR